MTGEPPAAGPDVELAERYEQLRAAVVDGRADGWRLGLGVLSGKGLAAWIRAWTACPFPSPVPAPAAPDPASRRVPAGLAGSELVQVLAAMALAHG